MFCFFSLESFFVKAIENFFPVFAYPDINTRGVGKVSTVMQTLHFVSGFAHLSRILPTPLVFISGYANTENILYCLNGEPLDQARRGEHG